MPLAAIVPSIIFLMAALLVGVLIPKNNETIYLQRFPPMKSWLTIEMQQGKAASLKKYNPKLGNMSKIN